MALCRRRTGDAGRASRSWRLSREMSFILYVARAPKPATSRINAAVISVVNPADAEELAGILEANGWTVRCVKVSHDEIPR